MLDLQKIISDLKASGIGVLITDHNVRETLSVTDRAYIINEGRIFRQGTPEQLGDPVSAYTWQSLRWLNLRAYCGRTQRILLSLRCEKHDKQIAQLGTLVTELLKAQRDCCELWKCTNIVDADDRQEERQTND